MRAERRISKGLRCRPLDDYRKKRDPDATPEPFGPPRRTRAGSSWCRSTPRAACTTTSGSRWTACSRAGRCPRALAATPRRSGWPSTSRTIPSSTRDFEGVIPDGNYGAGAVIVWDRGWYPARRRTARRASSSQRASSRSSCSASSCAGAGRWRAWAARTRSGCCSRRRDACAAERRGDRALSRVGAVRPHRRGGPRRARARLAAVREALARSGAPAGEVDARHAAVMLATLARARRSPDPAGSSRSSTTACACWPRARATRSRSTGGPGRTSPRAIRRSSTRAARAAGRRASCSTARSSRSTTSGRPSFQRLQNRMHLTRAADVERARGAVPVSAVFFDASRSRATTCAGCRCSSARPCWR